MSFRHFPGATGEYFMPEIMGSGCALFDYDRDGDLDLFLVQGMPLEEKKKAGDWKPGHRLFRNELIPSGKLRLTDVSERAGVNAVSYGMGVAVGDVDNDGDLDLFVSNFGPNQFFRNNGNGTFSEIAREAGVDDPRWSTSAAFLDYDRDGDLDLYVANYVDFTLRGHKRCTAPTGEQDYCTPAAYRPQPDRLYRNEGNGKFKDVTESAGIGAAVGPGLGVTCADFNGDGWSDIFVANDGAANLLWINQKDGTFAENGLLAGVAFAMTGLARAGMGAAAADFDNDGDQDLLVTNLTREGNTLFRNLTQQGRRGDFQDESDAFNITRYSFLSTGFGVGWFDYDNDGWLDLFAANGAVTIIPALKGSPHPFHQPNQLFHNEGESAGFREVTATAGPALQLSEVSRGAAFGDVDNDGDIDLLVANNNGPARLFLNETGARRHWLTVRLEGVKDNRLGLGAQVAVLRKAQKPLWRRAHTDGSYLSASDPRVHFGLGAAAEIEAVIVQWPGGEKESWSGVKADRQITLRQNSGKPWMP
ncbi:MAG: CRTAC1 family protein [Blastocatellia bacterium]